MSVSPSPVSPSAVSPLAMDLTGLSGIPLVVGAIVAIIAVLLVINLLPKKR